MTIDLRACMHLHARMWIGKQQSHQKEIMNYIVWVGTSLYYLCADMIEVNAKLDLHTDDKDVNVFALTRIHPRR